MYPSGGYPRGRAQSHSLLKPPLATFPVDAVKEESSRLFPKASASHAPIRSSVREYHSQSVEAQALEVLRRRVDLDEPPEERGATWRSVARELALEGGVRVTVIAVRHKQVLEHVAKASAQAPAVHMT